MWTILRASPHSAEIVDIADEQMRTLSQEAGTGNLRRGRKTTWAPIQMDKRCRFFHAHGGKGIDVESAAPSGVLGRHVARDLSASHKALTPNVVAGPGVSSLLCARHHRVLGRPTQDRLARRRCFIEPSPRRMNRRSLKPVSFSRLGAFRQ